MQSSEQPCALRALSDPDDQDEGCLALPCACEVERETDEIQREVARRRGYLRAGGLDRRGAEPSLEALLADGRVIHELRADLRYR
uniref:Uncharacterized protein n=1 Tax=uncultured prokaryote TaxID=198431 RepID=A0A0H5Q1Y5_9ZZZZ|nr:hypothetical protein [uncultured prokaryote]